MSASELPPIPVDGAIDGHVHLMPERLIEAIREALTGETGWTYDHPADRAGIESDLKSAGVSRYFALPYAHKPEMAADLNEWVIDQSKESEMAVPFATVHGEDDVEAVVREAFEAGARGLKFQCPVQDCGPADPRLDPAFELCAEYDRPVLFHAGTAPTYEDHPAVGFDKFEQFVESYPDVRACAAHLGTFEHESFMALAREEESVFLDTTMALSPKSPQFMDFDPSVIDDAEIENLSESIMYGTDFPNLPYPYADERRGILDRGLSTPALTDIFRDTPLRFLGE